MIKRRRNPFLVLGLCAIAMQSCSTFAGVRPCESQLFAQTPDPAPEVDPTPAPLPDIDNVAVELVDQLIVTANRQEGDLVDVALPVVAPATAKLTFTLDGSPPSDRSLRVAGQGAVTVARKGEHIVRVTGKWGAYTPTGLTVYILDAQADIGVVPAKPLIELVTAQQAPLLADAYLRLSKLAERFTSADNFWANHDGLLVALGEQAKVELLGHGATAAVKSRLTPWDQATLGATLAAISKEFGEPVKPDDPPPVDPTVKVTAVTYVYEKDDTAVPAGVSTGLNRLNREKNILATLFEDDTTDGDGDVPAQYVKPLAAAREQGLPALVVTAGSDVLKVVKDPRTAEQVFEAIAP